MPLTHVFPLSGKCKFAAVGYHHRQSLLSRYAINEGQVAHAHVLSRFRRRLGAERKTQEFVSRAGLGHYPFCRSAA